MECWYLVQLKPNSYKIAERNLNQQKFHTFSPMQVITIQKSKKFVTCLKPLFPGYMFLSINNISESFRKINSTIGISRLVSFNSKPSPIPLQLMLELMARCDRNGKLLKQRNLNVGDSVKLKSGPFANFATTVDYIDADKRVWVLMNLMGQNAKIKITKEQINLA